MIRRGIVAAAHARPAGEVRASTADRSSTIPTSDWRDMRWVFVTTFALTVVFTTIAGVL